MSKCEWWEPTLTDAAWAARIRSDYPKCADRNDEDLRRIFAKGRKYQVRWTPLGIPYDDYERLADAYLQLKASIKTAAQPVALHPVPLMESAQEPVPPQREPPQRWPLDRTADWPDQQPGQSKPPGGLPGQGMPTSLD